MAVVNTTDVFVEVKSRLWVSARGVIRILQADGRTVMVDFELTPDQMQRVRAVLGTFHE